MGIVNFKSKIYGGELFISLSSLEDRLSKIWFCSQRNKLGRGFGFVRFFEVSNIEMLALKLDNIFRGKQKFFVNLPRFQRSHKVASGVLKSTAMVTKCQGEGRMKECFRVKDGRSYTAPNLGKPQVTAVSPSYQMVFENVDEGTLTRFNKAFVGKVEKFGLTYNI